jgi:peptidoglycan/LPS O-acetylase OafA/YrhL
VTRVARFSEGAASVGGGSGARRADIQGLRALAIILVVADHVGVPFLEGGYVGVDVFFVISGFLITSHLATQLAETGRIDFVAFYARRMRRILPAALVVVTVVFFASLAFMPPLEWTNVMQMAIATAFYVPNLLLAVKGTDYLAGKEPSPLQHFWSLGVEEQFYLIWPLALLVLWLLSRRSPRILLASVCALVAVGFAGSVIAMGVSGPWSYFSLPTRAWELGVGAIIALGVSESARSGRARTAGAFRSLLSWAGLAAVVGSAVFYTQATPFPGTAALLPVIGTGLMLFAGVGTQGGLQRLLSRRPLTYIGDISYSLYLWHWPLLVIPQAYVGLKNHLPVWALCLLVLAAVLLAHLTYRLVEKPAQAARFLREHRPRRSIIAGFTAAALTATVALVALPLTAITPTSAARVADTVLPTRHPVFTPFVPSNMNPSLIGAPNEESVLQIQGCHIQAASDSTVNNCRFGEPHGSTSTVLFGDSHARHWFPAMDGWAKSNDSVLETFTKAGCSTVLVPILDGTSIYEPCVEWREKVLSKIKREAPDVLVIGNTSTLPFATDGEDRESVWAEGVRALMARVPDTTQVVVVANTPEFPEGMSRCLSHRLYSALQCGETRSKAIDQDWLDSERAAFEAEGALYLDLNDYFCSDTWCGAIIGNTLLYPDSSHITEAWSSMMDKPIADALRRAAARGASGRKHRSRR